MISAKAFYFFYYAAMGCFLPYLILYYEHLGLSGRQIGLLAAVMPLVMLFGAPFWGELADSRSQHRRVLALVIVGTLAPALIFPQVTTFPLLLVAVALFAFFISPVMPLVDNAVLEALGDKKGDYGRQRLWGAVGWGISAPLMGVLTQRYDITWGFYGYALLMLGGLVAALSLPMSARSITRRFGAGFGLLRNLPWLLFLAAVLLSGMGLAITSNFLLLHMSDVGATRTLIGLSMTFATVSEMPIMFFADRLLKRLGTHGLLILSLFVFVLRLVIYSVIGLPWLFLPAQLLHGPTFAAMWIAGVSYAKENAPPEMGAAAQGLFTAVLIGLGGVLGALLGGVLYDEIGGPALFRWVALGVLVGALALLANGRRKAPASAGATRASGSASSDA